MKPRSPRTVRDPLEAESAQTPPTQRGASGLPLPSAAAGTHLRALPTSLLQNRFGCLVLALPRRPEKPGKRKGHGNGDGARKVTYTGAACGPTQGPAPPPHLLPERGPTPPRLEGPHLTGPWAAGPSPALTAGAAGAAPARGEARRGRSKQGARGSRCSGGAGGNSGRPRLVNAALPGRDAATVPPGGPGTPVPWGPPSPSVSGSLRLACHVRSPRRNARAKGVFPAGGCRVPPPPLNGSPAPSLRTSASGPCHSRPKGWRGKGGRGLARLPGGSCDRLHGAQPPERRPGPARPCPRAAPLRAPLGCPRAPGGGAVSSRLLSRLPAPAAALAALPSSFFLLRCEGTWGLSAAWRTSCRVEMPRRPLVSRRALPPLISSSAALGDLAAEGDLTIFCPVPHWGASAPPQLGPTSVCRRRARGGVPVGAQPRWERWAAVCWWGLGVLGPGLPSHLGCGGCRLAGPGAGDLHPGTRRSLTGFGLKN